MAFKNPFKSNSKATFSAPGPQSAGILDDHAVRKVSQTIEFSAQRCLSGSLITNLNADLLDGHHSSYYAISGAGVVDHALLTNLDYASSNHTGFQISGSYMPSGAYLVSGANISLLTNNVPYVLSGASGISTGGTISGANINAIANYTGGYMVDGTAIGGYVSKEPAIYDYQIGSGLTADTNWHELDLSSKVPVGSKGVVLWLRLQDNVSSSWFQVMKNGYTNAQVALVSQVNGVIIDSNAIVGLDTNRKVMYRILAGTDFAALGVVGWFI